MSAYVSVCPLPPRVAVICTQCDIEQEYDRYPEAKDAAKLHNLFQHENAINWAE